MEELGILKQKFAKETQINKKSGKEYSFQGFVIEVPDDKFPRKVYFNAIGKAMEKIESAKVGDELRVLFNISSNEYKGSWYTKATAWGVDNNSSRQPQSSASSKANDDTPF